MTQDKEELKHGDTVQWTEGDCSYQGWVKTPQSSFPGEAEVKVTRKDGEVVGNIASIITFVKHEDISVVPPASRPDRTE